MSFEVLPGIAICTPEIYGDIEKLSVLEGRLPLINSTDVREAVAFPEEEGKAPDVKVVD